MGNRRRIAIVTAALSAVVIAVTLAKTVQLLGVDVDRLRWRVVGVYTFSELTDPLPVPVGETIIFEAVSSPAGVAWPSGKPTWSDNVAAVQGVPDEAEATFDTVSSSATDIKTVSATCGGTPKEAHVVVCGVSKLQYKLAQEDEYEDIPELFLVPIGEPVYFKAVVEPAGVQVPVSFFQWCGADPLGNGTEAIRVFTQASSDLQEKYSVEVTCGSSRAEVRATALDGLTLVPEYNYVGVGRQVTIRAKLFDDGEELLDVACDWSFSGGSGHVLFVSDTYNVTSVLVEGTAVSTHEEVVVNAHVSGGTEWAVPAELTVIELGLEASSDGTSFTPVTETLVVPVGGTLTFKAIMDDPSTPWLGDTPVWEGAEVLTGTPTTAEKTYETRSGSATSPFIVGATCQAADVQASVLACDLVGSLQYWYGELGWRNAGDELWVPSDIGTVHFRVALLPTGVEWPTGEPIWTGPTCSGPSGHQPSEAELDMTTVVGSGATVEVEWEGLSRTVNVRAIDLDWMTWAYRPFDSGEDWVGYAVTGFDPVPVKTGLRFTAYPTDGQFMDVFPLWKDLTTGDTTAASTFDCSFQELCSGTRDISAEFAGTTLTAHAKPTGIDTFEFNDGGGWGPVRGIIAVALEQNVTFRVSPEPAGDWPEDCPRWGVGDYGSGANHTPLVGEPEITASFGGTSVGRDDAVDEEHCWSVKAWCGDSLEAHVAVIDDNGQGLYLVPEWPSVATGERIRLKVMKMVSEPVRRMQLVPAPEYTCTWQMTAGAAYAHLGASAGSAVDLFGDAPSANATGEPLPVTVDVEIVRTEDGEETLRTSLQATFHVFELQGIQYRLNANDSFVAVVPGATIHVVRGSDIEFIAQLNPKDSSGAPAPFGKAVWSGDAGVRGQGMTIWHCFEILSDDCCGDTVTAECGTTKELWVVVCELDEFKLLDAATPGNTVTDDSAAPATGPTADNTLILAGDVQTGGSVTATMDLACTLKPAGLAPTDKVRWKITSIDSGTSGWSTQEGDIVTSPTVTWTQADGVSRLYKVSVYLDETFYRGSPGAGAGKRELYVLIVNAELELAEEGASPYLSVNDDFDEGKPDPDKDDDPPSLMSQAGSTVVTADLLKFKASILPELDASLFDLYDGGSVQLSTTSSDSGEIRVFAVKHSPDASVYVLMNTDLPSSYFRSTTDHDLYIEGINPGIVKLKLTYTRAGIGITSEDELEVTILKVEFDNVWERNLEALDNGNFPDYQKCIAIQHDDGAHKVNLLNYLKIEPTSLSFDDIKDFVSFQIEHPIFDTATIQNDSDLVYDDEDPGDLEIYAFGLELRADGRVQDRLIVVIYDEQTQQAYNATPGGWCATYAPPFTWVALLPPVYSALNAPPNRDPEPPNCEPGQWRNDVDPLSNNYHYGAAFEMRSRETPGGHGHQACYTSGGALIVPDGTEEALASCGTADFEHVSDIWGGSTHASEDAEPFIRAAQLDGNPVEGEGWGDCERLTHPLIRVGTNLQAYFVRRPPHTGTSVPAGQCCDPDSCGVH